LYIECSKEVGATQFVLVPSLNDAHHELVFPQPAFVNGAQGMETHFYEDYRVGSLRFPLCEEGPSQQVHLLPNPSTFKFDSSCFYILKKD
jgi:hypothetical protein